VGQDGEEARLLLADGRSIVERFTKDRALEFRTFSSEARQDA